MNPRLYETSNTDPTRNLAMEEALLLEGSDAPTLFLWQNAHTVVIGRGQNAWKECRSELLSQEGGTLVRRSTGGGAVYHDMGNLNFSFVMPLGIYDVSKQLNVIRQAVAAFGIETQASGRNDIVLSGSGAKFSGNAFRHTQKAALHHGTILMDVDMQLLGRYLQPSKQKLAAKGVESVRARVGNLKELAQEITITGLQEALGAAFVAAYGAGNKPGFEPVPELADVQKLTEKYRSWQWTYGKTPQFDLALEARFAWGGVELQLQVKNGQVSAVQCYTDANDPELFTLVEQSLPGSPFEKQAIKDRLVQTGSPELLELADWIAEQDL